MDIFRQYFNTRYDDINSIIDTQLAQRHSIAIWGAANRGRAFLELFDPECNRISCVYDKDASKQGKRMPTGHLISDYKFNPVDCVITTNYAFLLESIFHLKSNGFQGNVVNIEDLMLGGLNASDIMNRAQQRINLKRCERKKISAVTILYNPSEDVAENLKSYTPYLDEIYLYDNSPENNKKMFVDVEYACPIHYLHDGINRGIGAAVNSAADIAKEHGVDWLITFDQDSRALPDTIPQMREYVESVGYDRRVGMVVPVISSPVDGDEYRFTETAPYGTYVRIAIQSGAMHRIDVMNEIGGYNEDMFIDHVDSEYCLRCRQKGYYVFRLNHAILLNQCGEHVKVRYEGNGRRLYYEKYSPERYYYQYRNALYLMEFSKKFDQIIADDCKKYLSDVELRAENDLHKYENHTAIQQAKRDFHENRYGIRIQ